MKAIISNLAILAFLTGTGVPANAGGEMRGAAEVREGQFPQDLPSKPSRTGADGPNLIDRGGASVLRSITRGMRGERLASGAPQAAAAAKSMKQEFASNPKDIVIDVLIAYTKKAARYYSDIKRDLVDLSIEVANESFRLSNLAHIKLRVVHAYQTDYVEEGAHFDHVWRLADKGDGYMDEVHGLREMHRADVAVLIVDDPKGCGLATRVQADADEAFAVVHHECAAANYTLAHEVGHLIGARHELSYVNGNKWRDIMGVKERCGGCPRLPVWSSPTVLIDDEPAGTADHDNARVIAEQAGRVAAFR